MKKSLFLFIVFSTCILFGQKKYIINDFSEDYYLEINPKIVGEENYQLNLYKSKTKKLVLSTMAFLTEYDFEKLVSNIVQLPYGEQSIVIFDDFNFDGNKDLALKNGNYSCYGGPSFIVWLSVKGNFVQNKELTELAHENCGFFNVDKENKQLHTMTKSGCCWHKFSHYKFQGGKLILFKSVEESFESIFAVQKITERKNGKMLTVTKRFLPENTFKDDDIFLSYELENTKQLYLLKNFKNKLHYFFTKNDGEVELDFDGIFFYSKKENSLSFENKGAFYKIYNNRIEVSFKNKITVFKANVKTRQGNMSGIYVFFKEKNIENLEIVD